MLMAERRIMMKKILSLLIVIALVTAVVLTGCGKKEEATTEATETEVKADAETDATTEEETEAATEAADETASEETTAKDTSTDKEASNSVTVGISQEIDSLDPHNVAYAGTREVLFNLYDGLVKATSAGELEPAVASSYTISDDATEISFTLREGVMFSDGTPITSEDVKYSLERYAGIQGESSTFADFKEVIIEDDGTVKVVLSNPNSEFIYQLTCAIIPEWNEENVNTDPIGCGPFKYASYTPGESLVVVKNENYWKENCPYLDEVTFKIVTDTNTAIMELNAGTLDIYQYLTADQASTVDKDMFDIYEGNVNYVQALFLNNDVEPFDNVLVRQALWYAIDKDLINNMLFDGKSHPISTHMIPAFTSLYNTDTDSVYTHDVEKAKELLAEAGYPDGFEFTITVPNNYAPHEGTAQVIVECLAEAGIKANINLVEFTTWYSEAYVDRNYEATITAVDGTLAPSSWFLRNVTDGAKNFTNYSNEEFDATYALALAETDLEKKVEYYKECQMILTEDAASVYIQDLSNLVAVNSKLEGYVFYPISAQDMSVVKYK